MPPKGNYAKKGYRKNFRKAKKYNAKRKPFFRPQSLVKVGFPRTTAVKLRYVSTISINPAAAQVGYYFFRANSCYDPDYSGVGHQPMNFDQWSALYNHYIVVGSKINVFFCGDGGSSNVSLIYGCALTDDATVTTSPATIMENGTTKYRITTAAANYAQKRAPMMTQKFSCKKFFNITNPLDNITRLGAPITADPTEQALYSLFVGPLPDTAADIGATSLSVVIDYFVIFSEPKEQPQS